MENPRPEKVAVVDEVRQRFTDSDAALLTEYRGLDVAALAQLRTALRAIGSDYKIYKNTLVRFAARDAGLDIEELLVGPTAIAFVRQSSDGAPGDPVVVAKALRDFGRTNPALVVKGGVMGGSALSAADAKALAEVEPREVLLSRLAGGLASPMQTFAGLLEALPRNFAYGLKALIDKSGGVPEGATTDAAPTEPEAAPAAADESDSAPTDEPAAEAGTETETPEES